MGAPPPRGGGAGAWLRGLAGRSPAGALVLDGGLASALEARRGGTAFAGALWSAESLLSPAGRRAVSEVHLAYLAAGADVVSTCSYQASVQGLMEAGGLGREEARAALREAVALAQRAVGRFWDAGGSRQRAFRPLVAASVAPYGAHLRGGAEYTGAYGEASRADLAAFHRPQVEALAAAGPDLLAFETVPCLREVEAIRDLLGEGAAAGVPAWVSLSCRDAQATGAGDSVAECARALAGCPGVAAVGVNCTHPRHVAGALQELRAGATRAGGAEECPWVLLAYPNRGESWDAERLSWREAEAVADAEFARLAASWRAAHPGQPLAVGGCCRTTPATISAVAAALGRGLPEQAGGGGGGGQAPPKEQAE